MEKSMATKTTIDPFAVNQMESPSALTTEKHRGVMVSPGRYIDLSGSPLTLEQRMRASIQRAMRQGHFKYRSVRCEDMILECILTARHYREHPHVSFNGKKLTRLTFGTRRPNNRNQEGIRFYFLGMLWYVWFMGTGQKPVVNNRHNPDLPFVQFVKTIAPWFGLGNVIKNLERFQSYRSATLANVDKAPNNTAKKATSKAANKDIVTPFKRRSQDQ
jgi:hypothetical protein